MKLRIFPIALLTLVLLTACSNENNNEESTNLGTKDIKELVNDYSVGNIKDESASISSTQLIAVDNEENEVIYDLPEDEFFVSIAPFISQTHPCTIHSLTGCQGEMADTEFDIYIEDSEGNVVIDEAMKSEANGFIDLWLPRDETYQVKITHDGKQVESEFSTFEKDATCITTMQLV